MFYCVLAASAVTQDVSSSSSSSSQAVHVISPVNDEAIAMAALSSMADSISSSQLAPSTEQIPASTHHACSEHIVDYTEQINSEQITVTDSVAGHLHVAIDLSSANIEH